MKNEKSQFKKEKSFTLIEIIVAVSIFILIITAAMGIFVSSMKGKQRVNQLKEIEDNARYAMELMSREIRMVQSIDSDEAGTANSDITFTNSNGDQIVYDLASGRLRRKVGVGSANDITSNKVNIANITFYVNSFSSTVQPRVTISMTVASLDNSVSMNFQTTVSPKYDNSQ